MLVPKNNVMDMNDVMKRSQNFKKIDFSNVNNFFLVAPDGAHAS